MVKHYICIIADAYITGCTHVKDGAAEKAHISDFECHPIQNNSVPDSLHVHYKVVIKAPILKHVSTRVPEGSVPG